METDVFIRRFCRNLDCLRQITMGGQLHRFLARYPAASLVCPACHARGCIEIRSDGIQIDHERWWLLIRIDADLRGWSSSMHSDKESVLVEMVRLQELAKDGLIGSQCYHKAVPWTRSFEEGKKRARRILLRKRRRAGWRGGTRDQLREWLVATGRLEAENDSDFLRSAKIASYDPELERDREFLGSVGIATIE